MNEIVEKLLKPVSPEQPCGPDLSEGMALDDLTRLLKGKPEVEIGSVKKPAEPPPWGDLKDRAADYFAKSKHIQVAVILSCGWLQTSGLPGLRDGLQLIRGLLEQYWAAVYPVLAAEDDNDPTQRLNMLGALNSPRGTLMPETQQWLAIIDYIYAAPLCRPRGAEPISMDLVLAARKRSEGSPSDSGETALPQGPDLATIGKVFRATPAPDLEATRTAIVEAAEALEGIDQYLTQTLGAGGTISFDELRAVLKELVGVMNSNMPSAAAAGEAGTDAGAVGGEAGSPEIVNAGGIPISGSIRSRDDVVRALGAICEFYEQIEPSSPVPYLLQRAQKLAMMNFVEAVQELNIATVDSLKPSMGSAVEPPQPPA